MKSLKESLFDSDLAARELDGPINSFNDIQNIILDPIAKSLGIDVFCKTDNNSFNLITNKPKKFINIIESPLSSTAATYNISICYKLTQEKKQKYSKDIIRIMFQIRQEISKSNKLSVFKLDGISILDGKNSSFSIGKALDGTYKSPKTLKNIFNSDPNKYTVIRDYYWNEVGDITGVITYKNCKDIKNYFVDLFKKFFELLDKYDNSNMGEFMLTHKLKSILK